MSKTEVYFGVKLVGKIADVYLKMKGGLYPTHAEYIRELIRNEAERKGYKKDEIE